MKKVFAVVGAVICAIICAIFMILCLERVAVGNVGVVYSANGAVSYTHLDVYKRQDRAVG